MRQKGWWEMRALSISFLFHTLAPQDQCVEITEESKALLEEYNKTVSFLLSQAPEELCKALSFSSISNSVSFHPNQLYSPAPLPLWQMQNICTTSLRLLFLP